MDFDVIVIGAGAAGLMCAAAAGRRGRRVLVLDHNDQPGRKILISGGGRCNFTNLGVAPDRYLSGNPHFVTSALKRYRPADFLDLLRHHRIPWHERSHGELFCDRSAEDIVTMLLAECTAAGVELRYGLKAGAVSGDGPFTVATGAGGLSAASVVLATGGLSIPKIGASGFAHAVARRYDVPVVTPRPGLVPLTFAEADLALIRPLSGIAVDAIVSVGRARFREAVLLTHRGLSGPAVLQASSYWRDGESIAIDWLPDLDAAAYLLERKTSRPKAEVRTVLAEHLPARLAEMVTTRAGADARPIGQTPHAALTALGTELKNWKLTPTGTEGWRTAEITVGGIDTAALSSKTMEIKTRPGLFAVGEAADVAGWLGGYNFHWAWASGWVAGQFA
ncbi:NAD(P)/FAD-dependent oxidoreductase [Magnetospirillum fulvum]|uniref:Flavoprotein n=1 Tax=Magnetospirillum fulvum MGU-K5 TaxID=1316936 RepID=S9S7N4_MAGFU|nr:NAD(P)/FAD-dependent oxidoreductase [Magnetospirillum fulvum]EPY00634.1 flavoprotein [Magnetospirillum fulvum MGU-K5]